jgi:hypothetical protein
MLNPIQKSMLSGLVCPYCKASTEQMPARQYYGKDCGGFVWYCAPCKAVEWATADGSEAIGRVAKSELRRLRKELAQKLQTLIAYTQESHAEIIERLFTFLGVPADYRRLTYLSEDSCKAAQKWLQQEAEKRTIKEPQSPEWWRTKI